MKINIETPHLVLRPETDAELCQLEFLVKDLKLVSKAHVVIRQWDIEGLKIRLVDESEKIYDCR